MRTIGGQQTSYTYDANNRLIEMLAGGESVAFTYDANGNMLGSTGASGVNAFHYDGFNRLIESAMADGTWMRYGYDPEGMRASISENGMMTSFIFDGPHVIAETTADGQQISNYIRGHGLLAVEDPQGRIYNSLLNGHGDLTGLANANGEIVNSYSYDAFGQTTQNKELIANRFRYAGEQYDPITDNYYLRARHYAPSIGRFTQEDTYRGDGLNLYAYVGNNPVNYVDPTGHAAEGYVGVHHVAFFQYHTSVLIFVDQESEYWNHASFVDHFDEEKEMRFLTIGAGSIGGDLVGGINREKDVKLDIKVEMLSIDMDDEMIHKLLELADNFKINSERKNIDYDLFPWKNGGGYNSNSFVQGLLQAADYQEIPSPSRSVPGFSKAVPGEYFAQPQDVKVPKDMMELLKMWGCDTNEKQVWHPGY